MSENGCMRPRVIAALRALDAQPVENAVRVGVPDVNYADGWIELKRAKGWPKRARTPLRLPHFTNKQRVWLVRRARVSENVWLLLQVGHEWLLFRGAEAASFLGRDEGTREECIRRAARHWPRGLVDSELLEFLREMKK